MMTVFVYFPASEPHWNRKATTQWAFCVLDVGGLRVGNFAHGVVKAQAQDLDEEVDGVAGLVTLRRAALSRTSCMPAGTAMAP